MNPRVGAALFVLCLLGTGLFFFLRTPEAPEPAEPPRQKRTIVFPRDDLPTVAPRVYSFPRPTTEPASAPAPRPATQQPLDREIHKQLATSTNEAMGAGYQQCVRPWLEEDLVPEDTPTEPLVVFFDMVDGRLSDVRLRSPIEVPKDVATCFADAVWQSPFPEDPAHRGSVSVQRVIPIRK